MVEQDKRDFVAHMYPAYKWRKKVAAMSDAQVYAIWAKEQDRIASEAKKPKDDQDDIPF